MDKHTLDTFRARARKVTLPEDVRESVIDELRSERGERARGPRRPRREGPRVTRRTFVHAGAVAAGAAAAFLGVNALMNHAANKKGNWFALTAYAEGDEEGDGARLALGETFGGRISWSGGVDPATNGNDLLMAHTELNLSCTGDNVDTLTYRLEGDNVGTSTDAYFRPGIWIFQSNYEGSGPVASFTVDYDSQDTQSLQALLTGRGAYYAVYANVPVPDDLVPVFLELQEVGDTEEESPRRIELMHQVEVRAAELFAEELAKTTLVMTATFNDSTEQTKRYSFSPRENFVQIYDDYLTEDDEATLAGDDARRQELTQNPPSLYLITEA